MQAGRDLHASAYSKRKQWMTNERGVMNGMEVRLPGKGSLAEQPSFVRLGVEDRCAS
jgi:hypothetical protein